VPSRGHTKSKVSDHLFEFIWRRQNKDNLWESMLQCMKNTGYFEEDEDERDKNEENENRENEGENEEN
ncbi:20682_t:CDS:1, partial [Racocetra persica]